MPDPAILEWLKLGVEFVGVVVMLWLIVVRTPQRDREHDAELRAGREQFAAMLNAQREQFAKTLTAMSEKFERTMATEAERHTKENQEFRADLQDFIRWRNGRGNGGGAG